MPLKPYFLKIKCKLQNELNKTLLLLLLLLSSSRQLSLTAARAVGAAAVCKAVRVYPSPGPPFPSSVNCTTSNIAKTSNNVNLSLGFGNQYACKNPKIVPTIIKICELCLMLCTVVLSWSAMAEVSVLARALKRSVFPS